MLKKIIFNSGIQIAGRVISVVISVLIAGILTRNLGTTGYGNYVFISAFATLLVTTANWGTQTIGVRELSRTNEKAKLFKNLIFLRAFFSMITIIIGGMVIIFLPAFKEIRLISFIVLPLIAVSIFESTSFILYQAFIRMDLKSLFQTSSQIIFLGLTVFFLNKNLNIAAPLTAYLLAKLITGMISFPISKKLLSQTNKIKINKKRMTKLFWAALPLGAQLVLFTGYDQAVDSFIIKSYLNATQVGIYGLAYKIYANLILPAYYLNSTILPILSKNNARSKKSLKIASGLTIFGLIIIIPLTIIFSDFTVNLIGGSQFGQSSNILKILGVSLLFAYINHLTGFLLIAKDRQVDSLIIALFGLIWNLILNLIFIPQYGITAAAWITVSTEALVSLLSGGRLIWCYNKRQ
jgi:O-antigen/teichoic acid export membrane protein